jgi:hypothetical protein
MRLKGMCQRAISAGCWKNAQVLRVWQCLECPSAHPGWKWATAEIAIKSYARDHLLAPHFAGVFQFERADLLHRTSLKLALDPDTM